MTERLRISDVNFSAAHVADVRGGLLGWVSFVFEKTFVIESVAVRRTRVGRFVLSYPRRSDRHGRVHYDVRPLNDSARLAIEREVFSSLGINAQGEAP